MRLSLKIFILAAILGFSVGAQAHRPDSTSQQTRPAQTDSMLAKVLREEGITFSHDNSVTLLTNGREKFDDLFKAVEQARSSIHMEYFNFRNDSINKELITRLARKVAEGVEVRLIFDGFGNMSNNQPMRKKDIRRIRKTGAADGKSAAAGKRRPRR